MKKEPRFSVGDKVIGLDIFYYNLSRGDEVVYKIRHFTIDNIIQIGSVVYYESKKLNLKFLENDVYENIDELICFTRDSLVSNGIKR
jgi:hypothetical protein